MGDLYRYVGSTPAGHNETSYPIYVKVKPDYEAAAVAMAEDLPFALNWDRLADVEKEAHRKWAKIVVDAAFGEAGR
jgi:hypothetical protein